MIGQSLIFISTILLNSLEGGLRYPTINDFNDTTSWDNAQLVVGDSTYYAIFKHYFDEDFFVYTSLYLRSVAIIVESNSQTANIEIYKNSTTNLVASYDSTVNISYNDFNSYLICVAPSDTLFIKVDATTTASHYSLKVDTNPSLSGISISKYENINKPTHYFNVQGHPSQIKYYIDNSCNTYAGYGIKKYNDAFIDALIEWGKVGNLSLITVSSPSDANVSLYACNPEVLGFDLGDTNMEITRVWQFGYKYKFNCTSVRINNDYSYFGYYNEYETYLNIVSTCMQLIGFSIGLSYTTYERNYMVNNISYSTLNPYNTIGDGDVASFLDIYG